MKFSVLLPTRNRLDLLSYAIETVRRQDYGNWEIVISDNFSEEDVSSYVQSLCDERIKYFRTDRFLPVTDNWNNAISKSDGDYVIMLGDDDGLMKGYFSTVASIIYKFKSPDLIYTNAFLFAYPGVMPDNPEGFLRTYSRREIFQSARTPFWLENTKAMELVHQSINFRVLFDYNMQFSLVSRRLIRTMSKYGLFYQSPYPDYYASNALLIKANNVLIVPQPMVAIGISRKSFGYYFYNDQESSGNDFLKNTSDPRVIGCLRDVILPGPVMNTSWLISMKTLALNFSSEFTLQVNYKRYRQIQICAICLDTINNGRHAMHSNFKLIGNLARNELIFYLTRIALSLVAKLAYGKYREFFVDRIVSSTRSHPKIHLPTVNGEFSSMLDVFERVDPRSFLEDDKPVFY